MTHPTQTPAASSSAQTLYIGLDVGDSKTHGCVIDAARKVVERFSFSTSPDGVKRAMGERPSCQVVLEVGGQSPWMSRLLRELGHDVRVADARRVAGYLRFERKTDRRDAESLARILHGMPEMLGEVHHRAESAQADFAVIKARDVLVRSRTQLINHIRGTLKAIAVKVPSGSAASFHKRAREAAPDSHLPALEPLLEILDQLGRKIRAYEREIENLAEVRYPEVQLMTQVCGVGNLTGLTYVLTLEDPGRFDKSRTVGAWLGLAPRVAASGDRDPELPISKTGSPHLRRLLVQAAHYILGPFGKDCDLRRFGLAKAEQGGKNKKKRAIVAVARKLAVLLHRLWVSGAEYQPLRNQAS